MEILVKKNSEFENFDRAMQQVLSNRAKRISVTSRSFRVDTHLADKAAKVLGVKSRTEAVHVALREIIALRRFKDLMKKNAGKLSFAGQGE